MSILRKKGRRPGFECAMNWPPKRGYETLDEGWLTAWAVWALGIQQPMTPYLCSVTKRYTTWSRVLIQPNPWRWAPAVLEQRRVERANDGLRPCGRFHLTRGTRHLLSR